MNNLLYEQNSIARVKRADALTLDVELGSKGDDSQYKSKLRLKDKTWTPVHSFYAVMGGFVIDMRDSPVRKKYFPRSPKRYTLTPDNVLNVAKNQPSVLNIPSKAELWDKSKANGLAKVVVCLQAIWFLAQFISRLSQGLSASLLELTTAAHALCGLLIYTLWWKKPR